jgi:hypothetical protein
MRIPTVIRIAREGVTSLVVPATCEAIQIQRRGTPTAISEVSITAESVEPVPRARPRAVRLAVSRPFLISDTELYLNTALYLSGA